MAGWTELQIRTLALCFCLNMLDGADVLVVSFVAPVLTKEWAVPDAVFGLIFSSGLAGMTLGALMLAPFADLWGRKVLILVSTAVIASGMLASVLASSIPELALLRFWTGLGVGAMLASVASLASEYAPERFRSFAVTIATAGYPAGATLAGLAGGWIIPEFGWKGMFLLIGLGSVIIFPIVLLAMPESIQFLLARQPKNALHKANRYRAAQGLETYAMLPERAAEFRAPPVTHLLREKLRLGTLHIWGAFFASFFTLYFLTSWIPRIAVEAGYPLATAINGSAIFNLGAFIGLVTLGWLSARLELGKLIAVFFTLSALLMMAFGAKHTPIGLYFVGMLLIGFLVQGGFGGLYAIAARYYPTEVKTTGVGWAIGIGRLGAVAGPAVGGVALSAGLGIFKSFVLFAIPMLAAAGFTLLVARRCRTMDAEPSAEPQNSPLKGDLR